MLRVFEFIYGVSGEAWRTWDHDALKKIHGMAAGGRCDVTRSCRLPQRNGAFLVHSKLTRLPKMIHDESNSVVYNSHFTMVYGCLWYM